MSIYEVLADIRIAMAIAIFCAGGAVATLWWMILYLIGREEVKRMAKKKKGGKCGK